MTYSEAENTITSPVFPCNYEQQKRRAVSLYKKLAYSSQKDREYKMASFIAGSLLSCWYGTPWDFNGTTQTPGQGKIACGYFVTTSLRDAGMKIDRVKLAQCASQQLITATCYDIKKFSDKPLSYFVKEVEKSGYGLYIVGLDNHTGYIYHDGKEVWFIHSGFLPPRCALKEKAIESETLRRSRYRVVGRIKL